MNNKLEGIAWYALGVGVIAVGVGGKIARKVVLGRDYFIPSKPMVNRARTCFNNGAKCFENNKK